MSAPIYVDSNAQLAELAAHWHASPLLALDTEFVRETTFYPIAGLLQLGDAEHQYLIDPLRIDDWSPLQALFATGSYKVLHACSEDLELFARLLGALPQPLFDTQVGAALAGIGFSLSYQALVQTCLGIEVEKEQTRSDWVRRPLSEAQCHYAALDVAYLPAVFAQLAERLTALGRFEWWREDGERTIAASQLQTVPTLYYLKLAAAWRLQGPQLAVLQQLCVWREQQARERNVPRGRIVKDPQCIEIARCLPRTLSELAAVAELHPQQVRNEGAQLLELVARARELPAADYPLPPEPPLSREWGERLKRLRALIAERALDLNMPAEVLARKRDCELLLRTGALPDSLKGWREAEIGAPLLSLFKSMV
ncbi:MAG TPA: ribonuclease D [Spongiibacteraceae bacterium]|nr:ribonuclease D [Spongiibacteraceae bacterium]